MQYFSNLFFPVSFLLELRKSVNSNVRERNCFDLFLLKTGIQMDSCGRQEPKGGEEGLKKSESESSHDRGRGKMGGYP